MTANTNSPTEYHHKPNGLISFINFQTTINQEPSIIPIEEQSFLEDVSNPDSDRIVERFRGRRTGGSTLLGLIGLYNILNGKKVLYWTEQESMGNHFSRVTMDDIHVIGFEKVWQTRKKIRLEIDDRSTTHPLIVTHGTSHRGDSFDCIMVDGAMMSRIKLDRVINEVIPALRPDGKLIINASG